MLTGRKYRLALTPEQEAMCEEFGNICRAVWNTGLEQRREYCRRGAWMNYAPQSAELTEAKREHEWLRAAPSHILQQTLRDLDRACRRHGTMAVHWRSKTRWRPSFRFPAGKEIQVERLGRKWGRIKLHKLGWVKFRWSRPVGGEIRSATVSFKAGHWFVSILVDDGTETPKFHSKPGTAIGVDRGVRALAVTSDGHFHHRLFATPGEIARGRRLQQRLSRQELGSKNRHKTRIALGQLMGRAAYRRTDFHARIAKHLATGNSLIALEALRTQGLTASARGTIDKPGWNIPQKTALNRAILDKAWYGFEMAVRNAARRSGTLVVMVNPAFTSQRCYACGFVTEGNRESQAVFVCKNPGCGNRDHADVNAAKNIKAAGLAASACGDLGTGRSVKQEPADQVTGRTPIPGESTRRGGSQVAVSC